MYIHVWVVLHIHACMGGYMYMYVWVGTGIYVQEQGACGDRHWLTFYPGKDPITGWDQHSSRDGDVGLWESIDLHTCTPAQSRLNNL